MIWFLAFIVILLACIFTMIGIGFYEFYQEDKEDRKNWNRRTQYLHLKHLDDVNHQPK